MAKKISKKIIEQAGRVLAGMVERTIKDKEFRKLALNDFAGAYKEHTGRDLPDGVNMRFVEPGLGNPQAGLFELPSVTEELSDADLEKVAGGSAAIMMTALVAVYGVLPPTSVGAPAGTAAW